MVSLEVLPPRFPAFPHQVGTLSEEDDNTEPQAREKLTLVSSHKRLVHPGLRQAYQ